jgi:transposase
MTKRRSFSAKLKVTLALEALRGDRTAQEIAAKHKTHLLPTSVCLQTLRGNAGHDVEKAGN